MLRLEVSRDVTTRRTRSMLVVVAAALSFAAPGDAEAPAPWLTPMRLGLGQEPVLAASAGGDVVAAWRSVENGGVVRASFRPAGRQWQRIVEWPGFGVGPRVAVDREGNAIVVWIADRESQAVVEASVRPAGGRWEPPVALSPPSDWPTDARVGMDGGGNALVGWRSASSWPASIQTRYRSSQTGSWSAPVGIESYPYGELELSVSPGGRALLVWDVSFDVGYGVAASVGSGGRWEQPVVIGRSREAADYFTKPKAIAAAIGDRTAVVAWQYSVHGNGIVEATVRAAGGAWEDPVDLSFADGQAFSPAVAVDGAGDVTAAWDASVDIEGATRRAGSASWTRPIVASSSRGAPSLAVNTRGNAIAMWQAYDATPDAVQATRRPAAADPWSPTTELVTGDRIGAMEVAIDDAGDVIALWERNDGRWWVESSAWDISPPVVTKLVVPASGLIRTPVRFSVTARDTWSRILAPAWTFGDGSKTRGSAVTHRYRSPGRYRVTATVTDSLGHATTTVRTVRIRR